ncbi:hypothetical protein [Sphingobacterium chungjuense]|uniref:hypothetical protein n=1 Tax=Sphingobacterium chungjuense TaxID=2675553 RepID=UPI0014083720|nr:hypothetical protein [Sphingobacterium chungjuense]
MLRSLFLLIFPAALGLNTNSPAIKNTHHWQEVTDTIAPRRDTIGIEEVIIKREVLTPEEQFKRDSSEYRIIYLHGDNKNMIEAINIFPPVIVININKIYNHFSTSGKRARSMQKVLKDRFESDKVNQTWYPLTQQLAKLDGQQLEDFRRYYQPSYDWWVVAEEYEQLDYLFKRLRNYGDSASYIREYLALPIKEMPSFYDRK